MKTIHLSTDDGKNARVPLLRGRSETPKTVQVTPTGEEVLSKTVHRGNASIDLSSLEARALIEGDPEIDIDNVGKILPESSRAYRKPGQETMEGNFQVIVTTYGPDGAVRDKSPHKPKKANINALAAVTMGKRMPLAEMFRRFAFNNHYVLGHEDGIQHDFLLSIARDLEAKSEAATLGAGPKGNLPLIFKDGGTPTRAFLMGETDGDNYRLRVLLTRQELKVPPSRSGAETPAHADAAA